MNNPTHGFFHVALMGGLGGFSVASEMHGRLLSSGLYESSEKIHVSILSQDPEQTAFIIKYLFNRYPKYEVHTISRKTSLWEWPTLNYMREHCRKHNSDVWYVHTKGASNCTDYLYPHHQKCIVNWRGVMCRHVIDQHENCKKLLQQYDAVGPFLHIGNQATHFAGNFWWATSSHIRSLPDSAFTTERMDAEALIGRNPQAKLHNLIEYPDIDLYDFGMKYYPDGPLKGFPGAPF